MGDSQTDRTIDCNVAISHQSVFPPAHLNRGSRLAGSVVLLLY